MESKRKSKTVGGDSGGGSGGGDVSNFRMPLHYPRYTKEDYQKLPESMLDRLLAEYGLSSSAALDLDSKRAFAMGAFLWPNHQNAQPAVGTTATHRRHNTKSSDIIFPSLQSFMRKKRV